jgi:uncharacterized protein YjbJ (UPF0337 family)
MDENRIAGSAKNLGGQVQEEFGRVTGDTATQAKGSPTACTARLKTFTDKPPHGGRDCHSGVRLGFDENPQARLQQLFSKDIKNMDDLFVHTLRDIYHAEKQIVKALPEMVGKPAIRSSNRVSRRTCVRLKTMWGAWSRSSG